MHSTGSEFRSTEDKMHQVSFNDQNYYVYRQDGRNMMETVGPIGLIAETGSEEFAQKVNEHLYNIRMRYVEENPEFLQYSPGFIRQNYIIRSESTRFKNGEGKATLHNSVRGHDIYIISDVLNYSETFNYFGEQVPLAPDDHFTNVIRLTLAASNKPRRINVILPFLYEGRQDIRLNRESLDCAFALKELNSLGVESIITFDPHDSRVENALPKAGLENIPATYQLLEALISDDNKIPFDDNSRVMVVSPDETGMKRAMYYASVMGLPLGTFYLQRDPDVVVEARNPVTAMHFLGDDPEGRDIIFVDDMIVSGEALLRTAKLLKEKYKVRRIFAVTSFAIFTDGVEALNEAYEEGLIEKLYATNLNYHSPEVLAAPWFKNVDMSEYVAQLIDALNHHASISGLLDQTEMINQLLQQRRDERRMLSQMELDEL